MNQLRLLKKIIGIISVSLFVIEISCVLFQILSRNLTGRSYASIEEVVVILLPYFGLFSATYTLYLGNHVQIEFFYNKLPASIRRVLFILLQVAMIAAIAILMYGGVLLTIKQWKILTPGMQIPNGLRFTCFPIVGVFMLPLFFHNTFRAFHKEFDDTPGLAPVGRRPDEEVEK